MTSPAAPSDVHVVGEDGLGLRVVLLHGHGGSPEAMLDAAVTLHEAAAAQVLLPRGPVSADDGWAWWVPGQACDPATVAAVRGLARPPGACPTALAGFSQGGAMAVLTCATSPGTAAALAVVCGFVPDDVVDLPPAGPALPPTLVLHGEHDDVVDPLHGRMVARWCERQGAQVTSRSYAAGHEWPPEASRALAEWLDALGLRRAA